MRTPLDRECRRAAGDGSSLLSAARQARDAGDAPAHAAALLELFHAQMWPFGPPRPRIYYDPRTASPFARTWYLEWSTIARQAVTDRNALRELGFLRPTGRNDLGDDEEIDPIALAATTAPAAGTGAVAASTGGAAPAPAPVVTSAAGPSAASSTVVP